MISSDNSSSMLITDKAPEKHYLQLRDNLK